MKVAETFLSKHFTEIIQTVRKMHKLPIYSSMNFHKLKTTMTTTQIRKKYTTSSPEATSS